MRRLQKRQEEMRHKKVAQEVANHQTVPSPRALVYSAFFLLFSEGVRVKVAEQVQLLVLLVEVLHERLD